MRLGIVVALAMGIGGCSRAGAEPAPTPDQHAREAFDRYRQPDKLVALLGLREGERVADVGAGNGYLTLRLARAVGARGSVTATDVDERALDELAAALRNAPTEAARVRTMRVAPSEPSLEPQSYDLVLLSEVDHLLPDRADYLRKLIPAITRTGRIAVSNRRNFTRPLLAAAEAAGLRAREVAFSPTHFLIFLEVNR